MHCYNKFKMNSNDINSTNNAISTNYVIVDYEIIYSFLYPLLFTRECCKFKNATFDVNQYEMNYEKISDYNSNYNYYINFTINVEADNETNETNKITEEYLPISLVIGEGNYTEIKDYIIGIFDLNNCEIDVDAINIISKKINYCLQTNYKNLFSYFTQKKMIKFANNCFKLQPQCLFENIKTNKKN